MEIFINGKKVDYELDGEQTIEDVLHSLNHWVAQQGQVILTVTVDKESFALSEMHPFRKKDLAEAGSLAIEVSDVRVLAIDTLTEVLQYLGRIRSALPGLRDEIQSSPGVMSSKLEPLFEGLGWVRSVFDNIDVVLRIDYLNVWVEGKSFKRILQHLGDGIELLRKSRDEGDSATVQRLLAEVLPPILIKLENAVPELLKAAEEKSTNSHSLTLEEIFEHAQPLIAQLKTLPEQLEQVAVLLQTGHEHSGMNSLQEIIDVLETTLKMMEGMMSTGEINFSEISFNGTTLQQCNARLAGILAEVLGAFENQDKVLLADLLEYELSPIIEEISRGLELVVERFQPSIN